MITATRYHDFSYGHRVYNQGGKCENLHGHNGRVYFTIKGNKLDDVGRVIDFSVIKTLLCEWLEDNWDHKFLVGNEDPIKNYLIEIDSTVVIVPFNPTAENMAQYLVEVVAPIQLKGYDVELIKCRFDETIKCSATYEK